MPDKQIIVGVDTHAAIAIDQLGRRIDIPATLAAGYRSLLDWARQLGELCSFGVEGTSPYGAGLSRFPNDAGFGWLGRPGEPSTPPPLRYDRPR